MLLHPKGEGQWLIPGLCGKDRWNSQMPINDKSIRSVWLNQYQTINSLVGSIDVVIEKSPPNMVRLEKLLSIFKSTVVIANNRNPYANASSIPYRTMQPERMSVAERSKAFKRLASNWLQLSKVILDLTSRLNIPLVTYEHFCEDPSIAIKQLPMSEDFKASVNIHATLKVKDYDSQKIVNQNPRQLERLTASDIEAVSSILSTHEDLLSCFDYEIL